MSSVPVVSTGEELDRVVCESDRDSAAVYDLLHRRSKSYDVEAEAIGDLIDDRLPGARTLLDVACGTGEHLRYLSRSFEVTGVDASPAMLRVAANKLHDVALHCSDMRTFRLSGRFDAVTCLFSSIGYLASTADLHAAIANMSAHLRTGGVMIVEPWHHRDVWPPGHAYSESVGDAELTITRNLSVSVSAAVSTLRMRYSVADSTGIRAFEEEHRLSLFSVDEYVSAFRAAGLSVEHEAVGISGRGVFVASS